MSYPGNPALAPDIQQRITGTFTQTLALIAQGREQEAVLGCEFILHLDPAYPPASQLLERLRSTVRPIETRDLLAAVAAGSPLPTSAVHAQPPSPPPAAAGAGLTDFGSLGDHDDFGDLGDLEGFTAQSPPPAAPRAPQPPASQPTAPASATSGLLTVLQDLLARRNFQQILQIAASQKATLERDPRLQAVVKTAQEHLESEPFVQKFLTGASQALAAGKAREAEGLLEKALALDAGHPQIASLAVKIAAAAAAAPPAAPPAPAPGMLSFDDEPSFVAAPAARKPASPPAAGPLDADLAALQQVSLTLSDKDEFGGLGELDDLAEPAAAASFAADDVVDVADDAMVIERDDDDPGVSAFATFGDREEEEGAERVAKLLTEGQENFERGEFQAAINVWSRIFLIDLDNEDASRRIELARSRKAEAERQLEELIHEGVKHIEASSLDAAKATFQKVLQMDPGHSLAKEYLAQLEAGEVPILAGSAGLGLTQEDLPEGVMDPEAMLAAKQREAASMEAAVRRDRIVVTKKTDWRLIGLGAVVLLAAIAGGYFLVRNWRSLFPNAASPPASAAGVPAMDPIERATKVQQSGNTANAIILLEKIQPEDARYQDAQTLLAKWRALVQTTPPSATDTGPPAEQVQRRNLLLAAARQAHGKGQNLQARKLFDRAHRILPLESGDFALRRECDERLRPLQEEINLFAQGDYLKAIPTLWQKREAAPKDPDIARLLIDSYYNLALRDLQRGDVSAAAEKLTEVVEVDPEAEDLVRLQLFAKTYMQRPQDLLYRIMVKYLPART